MNRKSLKQPIWAPDEIYQALLAYFGPQRWWPGETKIEIVVGAILTQNTDWRNVERSISRLKAANTLTLEALQLIDPILLQELIKPSGFMTAKSRTIQSTVNWLLTSQVFSNGMDASTHELRSQLMAIKGIGEETADSILLYALERPVAMADGYTRRIGNRIGFLEENANYRTCADWVETLAPLTAYDQGEIHAFIVRLAKAVCFKRAPNCADCPLTGKCSRIGC